MSKLVSAVITTHNRKNLLLKAIQSVMKQTYDNMECIVVDDASTDGTQNVLEEFIRENKITYIYIKPEESKGGNYARNIGIKNAKGEYIAFLDDDDEWLPDKTEKQVKVLDSKEEIGFVYCGRLLEKNFDRDHLMVEDCNTKLKDGNLSKEVLIHSIAMTSTIMVRKNLILQAGMFDEELKFWQEYELCIRILQCTEAFCVRENLVLYRILSKDKNRLSNKIEGWERAVSYITEKHKKLFNSLNEKEEALRQVYICIDGFNRAKHVKSITYMFKYAWIALKDKNIRRIVIKKFLKREVNLSDD